MKTGANQEHSLVTAGELVWGEGPKGLPAGAQLATLKGDMSKPELFTIRLKFPAGYKVPPHFHPADEHVTVISGTAYFGMKDTLDEGSAKALPKGGFAMMPAGMTHYAFVKEETEIQIHGQGPWGITYINPKDDPRIK